MDDSLNEFAKVTQQIEDAAHAVASLGLIAYEDAVNNITQMVRSYSEVNFGEVVKGDINLSVNEDGMVRVTQPMTVPPMTSAAPARLRYQKRRQWLKEVNNL